jgi:hypothetical protein
LKDKGEGMVSYKWIEECCRNGELVDMDDHRIFKKANGPTAPFGRSIRGNEFTAEDDKILIKYLKQQYKNGAALSGNKPYDALAVKVLKISVIC